MPSQRLGKILFATSNPHKIREVGEVLGASGCSIAGLDSLNESFPEPLEDGDSFEDNARIKALGYAQSTGMSCLAEDSGLEVDALGGAPGVHSARYSGISGDRASVDRANNEKLIDAVAGMSPSELSARFVCAMCWVSATGEVLGETRGVYEGLITTEPRGENGFGYDPLLWLPDVGKTSAELAPEEKNARSHRGAATRAMLQLMLAQNG
ncbi:MAG: RdgB/HAM1 family non-canonical purine NTP pyrophosphatase [Polyangiaceae bacterium]|nr:RdgB/HAM1 family non-canonical purine NTP pyrophosphatase [Polyangiaceae bacterium]